MFRSCRIGTLDGATIGLLAVFTVAALVQPVAGDPPATIRMSGIVRDFQKDNSNLVAMPSGGTGHYAGNVATSIGVDDRPVFVGGGYRVNSQWRNSSGQPIPPHLATSAGSVGGVISVITLPSIANNPTIDSFNSAVGPYGGSNIGPAPTWVANSPMPAVSEPLGMPAQVNAVTYSGNSTSTLSANLNCNTFLLRNNHTLKISGHRTIVAQISFSVQNHTRIEILPNSSLTVYIKGSCTFSNNIDANVNTWTPSKFMIVNLGTQDITLDNHIELYAVVLAPTATLNMGNNVDFCGNFTGKTVTLSNSAGFHNDGAGTPMPSMCSVALNDAAGAKGATSTGGIPSASAFATWFNDVLGTNASNACTITLTNNGGVWEYLNDSFFPLHNQLFGNQNESHNNFFTYAIRAQFVHHACAGKFFEFRGHDDAWLFINGKLAMDLGGVIPGSAQYLEIDRLSDLQDGQTYTLWFFHARRQADYAVFRLRTNLDLIDAPPPPPITGAFD